VSIQNLRAVRTAMADLLRGQVSMLNTVLPYEDTVENNELPCLMIWRDGIRRRNSNEPEDQLYAYKSAVDWVLRIYTGVLPGERQAAQEEHDALLQQVFAVMDANDMLDPNGPGVVDDMVVESASTEVIPGSTTANRQTMEMLFTEATVVTYSNTP
jgi:hypothetical protein